MKLFGSLLLFFISLPQIFANNRRRSDNVEVCHALGGDFHSYATDIVTKASQICSCLKDSRSFSMSNGAGGDLCLNNLNITGSISYLYDYYPCLTMEGAKCEVILNILIRKYCENLERLYGTDSSNRVEVSLLYNLSEYDNNLDDHDPSDSPSSRFESENNFGSQA